MIDENKFLDALGDIDDEFLLEEYDNYNKSKKIIRFEKYLKKEKIIHNSDVQQLLEVSSATANRILVSFVKEGKLERVRDGRYWAYQKL